MKNSYVNNLTITNLYKKKSLKSKIDTQLLYGENFRVIKKINNWKKIRIERDGYTGFIKGKKFSYPIQANFKVSVLKAKLFSKPNINKSNGIKNIVFTFKNFLESQKFVNEVGRVSEDEGHHPDIMFGWGYAKINITTHAIEGLSENDFILAAKIDNITNA